MRVGIVTAPLDYGQSGPGIYLRNLVDRLAAFDDIDLRLIHYEHSTDPVYEKATDVVLPRVPGVYEYRVSQLDLDVLHYNYVPYKRPLVFGIDTNLVVTVHGDISFVLPEHAPREKIYLWKPLQQFYAKVGVLDRIDAFIAVSDSVSAGFSTGLNIPQSKMTTVYSGVDDRFEPKPDGAATVESKYGVEGPYVLNINNYAEKKNRATLVEGFAHVAETHPNVTLVLAGGGWEDSDIHERIRARGLSESVTDLGFVPDEDLPALYSGATVYVNPTLHETFGFTNVEAMACGCPVITSDRYGIPEVVGDAAVLLSDPKDSATLGETISSLLDDEERRRSLSERGRQRAERFDWERTAEETAAVYASVLASET